MSANATTSVAQDGFYAKELRSGEILIRAHSSVPDEALAAARDRVERMLAKAPRLRSNCESSGMEVLVAGKTQLLTDLPEYRHYKGKRLENGEDFDMHTRGAGKLVGRFTSCSEGNLLDYVGDRFYRQDVCIHELAHALMFLGMTARQRAAVIERYEAAMREGKWKAAYASTNYPEFFADLSIAYFGSKIPTAGSLPRYAPGAAWLKEYDPASYAVLDDIYIEKRDPGERRVVELLPRSPKELHKLRSASGLPMRFTLSNATQSRVRFYWIDFKGQRAQSRDLPPGGTQDIDSYASHVFLVVGPDDAPRALYVMGEDDATATIC